MGVKTFPRSLDTTASMQQELTAVKAAIEQEVYAAAASGEAQQYVLVSFIDDATREPIVTPDPGRFVFELQALSTTPNPDCPEPSLGGTLRAINAVVPGSTVVVHTDADAKDAQLASAVKTRASELDVQVEFRLTGQCNSQVDPVYLDIARETGGRVFRVEPEELQALSALTISQMASDAQALFVGHGVLSGSPQVFTVSIDPGVRHAVFSASGATAITLSVSRPDGSPITAGTVGATVHNLSRAGIVAIEAPSPGSWTMTVQGTGHYSVSVQGNSPISISRFAFADHVNIKHPGFFEIQGQPIAGQPATAVGRVVGSSSQITFDAVSLEGNVLATFEMETGHPDTAGGDYAGTFTLPSEPFRVVARGTDGGFPFQRMLPRVFRPQPVRVLPDVVPESVNIDSESVVTFVIWNAGPARTFNITALDDRGVVTGVSPQAVTLQQNGTGTVQVTVRPPEETPDGTAIYVTLTAAAQGDGGLANSASVALEARRLPPAEPEATYYLHRETLPVPPFFRVLKSIPGVSDALVLTSGNMKGRPAQSGGISGWKTEPGKPGYAGTIPVASTVTATLWMRKTTNWGTVFPRVTVHAPTQLCTATGDIALTTTWTSYTISCNTIAPITMLDTDEVIVSPGYAMTVPPGNHNMEIQLQIEGSTDGIVVVPNPQ